MDVNQKWLVVDSKGFFSAEAEGGYEYGNRAGESASARTSYQFKSTAMPWDDAGLYCNDDVNGMVHGFDSGSRGDSRLRYKFSSIPGPQHMLNTTCPRVNIGFKYPEGSCTGPCFSPSRTDSGPIREQHHASNALVYEVLRSFLKNVGRHPRMPGLDAIIGSTNRSYGDYLLNLNLERYEQELVPEIAERICTGTPKNVRSLPGFKPAVSGVCQCDPCLRKTFMEIITLSLSITQTAFTVLTLAGAYLLASRGGTTVDLHDIEGGIQEFLKEHHTQFLENLIAEAEIKERGTSILEKLLSARKSRRDSLRPQSVSPAEVEVEMAVVQPAAINSRLQLRPATPSPPDYSGPAALAMTPSTTFSLAGSTDGAKNTNPMAMGMAGIKAAAKYPDAAPSGAEQDILLKRQSRRELKPLE